MNSLGANYKIILEVLQKVSKNQLLPYQRRKPKLSDLELISLNLTAEYMSIVKMIYLENFLHFYLLRLNKVFTIEGSEN